MRQHALLNRAPRTIILSNTHYMSIWNTLMVRTTFISSVSDLLAESKSRQATDIYAGMTARSDADLYRRIRHTGAPTAIRTAI